MMGEGADTIGIFPHSPIQSTPMAVHDHDAARRRCSRRNQLPLMRAVPMRSDSPCGMWILNDVVVQSHDPAGAWILSGSNLECADLFGRYQAERVGKRKVRFSVGVQHDDPQAVVAVRR
jgi:hypothetical protein